MRNSFETTAHLDSADIIHIHKKAEKTIESARIKEESFKKLYGKEAVDGDIEKVKELEAKFGSGKQELSGEMKKLADIFEALILENGELSDWFGENALTRKASRFDDYIRGIDIIIEFPGEEGSGSYLGLATDVTFANDAPKKFNRIEAQIERGELASVRYVNLKKKTAKGDASVPIEVMPQEGEVTLVHTSALENKMPAVVIGVSGNMVSEVAELWTGGPKKELATHRVQIMILRQIKKQLETFDMHAASLGHDHLSIVYKNCLGIIEHVLASKATIARKADMESTYDQVHTSIIDYCDGWQRRIQQRKAAA